MSNLVNIRWTITDCGSAVQGFPVQEIQFHPHTRNLTTSSSDFEIEEAIYKATREAFDDDFCPEPTSLNESVVRVREAIKANEYERNQLAKKKEVDRLYEPAAKAVAAFMLDNQLMSVAVERLLTGVMRFCENSNEANFENALHSAINTYKQATGKGDLCD